MAKRLIQGPAMPVWLVDSAGNAGAEVSTTPQLARAVYCDTPIANTAATITMGAPPVGHNVIGLITWSYNATPTGGALQITDGGAQMFYVNITTSGPGFIPFDPPARFADASAVVVRLAAGGAAVTGALNVHGWVES